MQLEIIYEDRDILVCFKPAGVATQTAKLSSQDMVSLIKNYLAKKENVKNPYVGVIHRLDQPVSGLLVFTKNQKAAGILSKQIQDGNANKDYVALCSGILEEKSGELVHYIMKDSVTKLAAVLNKKAFLKMQAENKEGSATYKKAILIYDVEKEFEDSSIIRIHLQTGRFHQIRAQFSYIGHPLLGDLKYGNEDSKLLSSQKGIGTIALCAYEVSFLHPRIKKEMKFQIPHGLLPPWISTEEKEKR